MTAQPIRTCVQCSHIQSDGDFCERCGSSLPEPQTPPKRGPQTASPNMCANCGAALDLDDGFCGSCGAPAPSTARQWSPPPRAASPQPYPSESRPVYIPQPATQKTGGIGCLPIGLIALGLIMALGGGFVSPSGIVVGIVLLGVGIFVAVQRGKRGSGQ